MCSLAGLCRIVMKITAVGYILGAIIRVGCKKLWFSSSSEKGFVLE